MSKKNNKAKRFVLIMSVIVILIIIIGSWLTWKIVEDGMEESASDQIALLIEGSQLSDHFYSDE